MSSQKKKFCFCDDCFGQYAESLDDHTQSLDVPAERRFDWLTQRGLLGNFEQSLEDRLAKLAGEMMVDVRKIKPDFLFGFYPYAPFWYYDGLIRGGGNPKLPCLLFPSTEYDGGYVRQASPRTFFGEVSTPAALQHIQRRRLPALYAGGLWTKAIDSPDAITTAMDRLLRDADGYWVYDRVSDPFWQRAATMNRWSTEHRGKLGQGAAAKQAYSTDWQGRGALPKLDSTVFRSHRPSIRFEPSSSGKTPISPFIERKISAQDASPGGRYELSFWVRCRSTSPIHFWVGQANSNQHPAYMYYQNFVLQPGKKWQRQRISVRYKSDPPLVLRFWVQPTDGIVWLDDLKLRPVQSRTIDVPLTPPDQSSGWGAIEWRLSPSDD